MATTSSGVQQLYADIVADLVPYYMDAVLLPNQEIIQNSLLVAGSSGDQVRFPLTNSYTSAASLNEGDSISGAATSDFTPTSANISFQKRGVATDVHEEALEDGGMDMVRNAVLVRLSGGLAEATDVAGLAQANSSFTTHTDTGEGSSAATHKVSFVMSPEGMAYAAKREPVVKMWYNPNRDWHEFRGTVRNGFTVLRAGFGQRITANATIGSATANVEAIAKGVANLRSQNAPTGLDGSYIGIIDPAYEFAINKQLAQVGGSTISSLSDIGNNALRDATIAMIAGVKLFRSNNLPNA